MEVKQVRRTRENRGQWANKREFVLAVLGQLIGLANFWRFPYLCFKNGGGVFLVPYLVFLLTCGIPLFFAETSLGQFTQEGGITCWSSICLLAKGMGFSSQLIIFYSLVDYTIILAWTFFYLFSSFSATLPWSRCNNTWNTDRCSDYGGNFTSESNATSASTEFWLRRVLRLSGGIEEMGEVHWELAGCLLLSWILSYFCVWKGVKTSGKVVYFTATFPYLMLMVLLIRGLTLPGAVDGLVFYLYPEPARLTDIQVWMDAGNQVLTSLSLCAGCLQVLGSYNKFNNNCYRDAIYLCLVNAVTSLVAGFAVFSVLGFMSRELNQDISVVADSGPGLAFITYPSAIALMPVPQLWASLFFIMILLLGVDSQFLCLEAWVTSISDMFTFFYTGRRRQFLLVSTCVVCYLLGLCMVTEGGLYVFLLSDYYGSNGMSLMLFAIIESVCIGWVYGADRYYKNVEQMIGYRPSPYMKYCWKFVTPTLCTVILTLSLIRFTPLKYNNVYQYPWWGYGIGIFLSVSIISIIPVWVLYVLKVSTGSLRQRLNTLIRPVVHDGASQNKRQEAPPSSSRNCVL
ncbi:sodium- and chloride-dependent GABA transporter 2-like isoform X2 [Synchiropus splendidus]|uniref:sodium- and chloride-dependent GABA transporter 2-like isoform X2 n=1 Tax=Synchiropus splendidus TaxID=270530 RepID=UPI00237E2E5E|nr:sodium- and chloride-dependent GABA transporter 2-like isoform X2 [Synchiropus splendidus]